MLVSNYSKHSTMMTNINFVFHQLHPRRQKSVGMRFSITLILIPTKN